MENRFAELRQKRIEKQRKAKQDTERKHYWRQRDSFLKTQKQAVMKRRKLIRKLLGNKCTICGSRYSLVIHHVRYNGTFNTTPTLDDLKTGKLVLVCRAHHFSIHFINGLKFKGELEKVLALANDKPRPLTMKKEGP